MATPSAEYRTAGHRTRLLQRFQQGGIQAFHDYEILELLLTYAIPRKDTKELAKSLLRHYKSLSGVLHAEPAQLQHFEGIGARAAHLFILMKEVMAWCLHESYDKRPIIAHSNDVRDYLRFHYGHRGYEYVAALFLDNAHAVIATEVIAEGTANQCVIYPRAVVESALKNKAAAFLVAHNHPGGTLNPSVADWKITRRLFQIGKLLDMPLLDHIIICKTATVSLKDHVEWPK
ncbi:MAG: DNA repair protein RadC [Chitinivibrionales bacterium]|nr:DNA repair protein RadC [Chitinivibrionales bacterium]